MSRTLKDYMEGHNPDETGLWKITGADQSCGGMYDRSFYPDLGIFEGMYKDAVKYALKQNMFFGWSGGGTVTKVRPRRKTD